MRRVHDIRCVECQSVRLDVVVEDDYPPCDNCGGETTWIPSKISTDIWGQPTYVKSLDQEFGSRSELKAYLKANGLQEAGDKVNVARTFRMPERPKTPNRAYRISASQVEERRKPR